MRGLLGIKYVAGLFFHSFEGTLKSSSDDDAEVVDRYHGLAAVPNEGTFAGERRAKIRDPMVRLASYFI